MFDNAFQLFLSPETIMFCLGIWILTYIQRTLVEAPAKKNLRMKAFVEHWVWTDLMLPLGPIFTGIALAFLSKKFPFPTLIADSGSHTAKLFYGGICGMASGWFYARVRAFFGVAADRGNEFAAKVLKRPASIRPPANTEEEPPAA